MAISAPIMPTTRPHIVITNPMPPESVRSDVVDSVDAAPIRMIVNPVDATPVAIALAGCDRHERAERHSHNQKRDQQSFHFSPSRSDKS